MSLIFDAGWLLESQFEAAAALDSGPDSWPVEEFKAAYLDSSVRGILLIGGRQAIFENKPIGCVVYRFDREAVRIHRVVVLEKYRRRGVGSLLVKYATNNDPDFTNRGYRFVSATVPERNLPARELFRSAGLSCVGSDEFGFRFAGLI